MDTLPIMQPPKPKGRRDHKPTPANNYIIEKNPRAKAYEPPYHLNPKRVIAESKHTYTTEDNRTIQKN